VKPKDFPIPVVTVAPGSQDEGEEALDFLEMPREMSTFQMPQLPESGAQESAAEARAALRWLHAATRDWRPGMKNPVFDAAVLDAHNREIIDQVLGEGEVAIIVAGQPETRIQESVFAGVWRVRRIDRSGSVVGDHIEVGPVPEIALTAARAAATTAIPALPLPPDAFGAGPVLEEVAHHTATRRRGDPSHMINLSLMPLSPADGRHLGEVLAAGPVRVLSRGYGNCRITSTVVADTWWVRYVNGFGNPMVDSIEVTDVPEVALAAAVDIADSAQRVREALEWLERS
jgi:hydrogenase-1 operon protein HyaF